MVKSFNTRLYSLGFTERVPKDLEKMVGSNKRQKQTTRELAMWYANQRTEMDAKRCLELLNTLIIHEKNPKRFRKTAVMVAECNKLLGDHARAKNILDQALSIEAHPDLYFSYANLETLIEKKLYWINKAFALENHTSISYKSAPGLPQLDRLISGNCSSAKLKSSGNCPKVSVIIPVHNAESTIRTALDALFAQTWPNLELIVVDDGSIDQTVDIISHFAINDPRIKLIMNKINSGPYVARNLALKTADGEYITCHDADDWSHPEMIESQVTHLINNPKVIGNISQQVRTTPDLNFHRRNRYGTLVTKNFPSFMFRREPVTKMFGFWDCVRFSADHELIRRIKHIFGQDAIINLKTGPLCFQRERHTSLTGDPYFGSMGHYMGARKEYFEAHTHYHNNSRNLFYDFPQKKRPFPVPEPMWIKREKKPDGYRLFDIVFASDFRMTGSHTDLNIKRIKSFMSEGKRIGLVQLSRYDLDPNLVVCPQVRRLIDGERLQMLVYGEIIICKSLIVSHFPALQEWQMYLPEINTRDLHVIVDQLPILEKDEDIKEGVTSCAKNLIRYFGKTGRWYPATSAIEEKVVNCNKYIENKPIITNHDFDRFLF